MYYENFQEACELVRNSAAAYCHYITPNDVGATGGHQYGFVFSKAFYKIFFDEPGVKGSNKDVFIRIKWQNDFETDSRAIYYGVGTRNEYRITRFGRNFEFLRDDYVGCLMIMTRSVDGEYLAYVLADQTNIENFMAEFNLDITKGNQWIGAEQPFTPDEHVREDFNGFIEQCNEFPDTNIMANFARECICRAFKYSRDKIAVKPDDILLQWVDAEYKLFGSIEEKLYRPIFTQPFDSCQKLIDFSNSILNRRKSRAGKSLEHHLSAIFTASDIRFEEQVRTEGNKTPDFIFPDGECYHNFEFPADKLTMLGAKTTCKDRWRQVLNEADRIKEKHLFTLQPGISKNQLAEMQAEHLTLVVPRSNIDRFDPQYRSSILCLKDFVSMVRERQERI